MAISDSSSNNLENQHGEHMTQQSSQSNRSSSNKNITPFKLTVSLLTVLSLTLVLSLSCSKNNPVDGQTGGPISVTVQPVTGPPLTSVTVVGLDTTNIDLSKNYAYLNGSLAPLFISDSGLIKVTIPAIIDSVTKWIDTTITSMSLVIVKAETGDTVAIGADIFTLEALLPAPGSVTQMLTDWGTISTSLKTISQALGTGPGAEEQVTSALLSALDSLINGSDTLSLKSLSAQLSAGSPQDLALLDALFGSSGVVEQSQGYAVMLQAMADSATLLVGPQLHRGAIVPTVLTDAQLAFRMQFYVVIREFGRTVLTPTAQTYAIVTGAIGLVGNIPIASIISATLTVIDFVVNKLVVSTLPASIDSLRITVVEDTIFVGEQVNSKVMIYAANDPQAITLNDMVGQLLNGMGLTASAFSPRSINAIEDLFTNVANYMVGLLQAGVSAYSGNHPTLNLDITLTTMPPLRWEAQITDTKFLNVKSHTPTIIKPVAGVVQWQADSSNTGEGRIFATTTASGATVIPEPTGFAYSAGAFGENVAGAPAVSVWSLKKLAMVVDMAPDISHGGINILGVKVGTINAAGDTTFEAGFKVDLTPIGGTATPSTGFTDATGQFSSDIRLDAQSDTVIIHITASNTTSGSTAKDTATAAVPLATNSRIAHVSWRDGAPGIWSVNPNDTSDNIKLCTVFPPEYSPFPVRWIYWSTDAQSLIYTIGGFFGTGVYSTSGTGGSFQRTIFAANRYRVKEPNAQSWFTNSPSDFLIGASHRTISSLRGQYICNAFGSRNLVTGSNHNYAMFLSPDDQRVAFVNSCAPGMNCVSVMNANNLASGIITNIAGPFVDSTTGYSKIVGWTRDGASIIYYQNVATSTTRTFKLKIVNANGSNDRILTSGSGNLNFAVELPTKDAIAINVSHPTGSNSTIDSRLKVVSFSGTVNEIITPHTDIALISPSPNGEFLAFEVQQRPQMIRKINLTTRAITVLVSDSLALTPAWSGNIQP
ncbi:hypothetical protein JYU19_02500 [bacterium AH-315-J21]|nr:hypothetical protein [bacterium AH-315-J21]